MVQIISSHGDHVRNGSVVHDGNHLANESKVDSRFLNPLDQRKMSRRKFVGIGPESPVRLAPHHNSGIGFDINGPTAGRFHRLVEKVFEFLRDALILNPRRHDDSPSKQRELLKNPLAYLHFHDLVSPHTGLCLQSGPQIIRYGSLHLGHRNSVNSFRSMRAARCYVLNAFITARSPSKQKRDGSWAAVSCDRIYRFL